MNDEIVTGRIIDFCANQPHNVAEVICVKCGKRWLAVWPEKTLLRELHCSNCGPGYVIKTGQDLEDEDAKRHNETNTN